MRLPLGSTGASDSPYLSLISLLKGWPENKMRREVLMVTDGVDRLRNLSWNISFYGNWDNRPPANFQAATTAPARG